MLSPEKRGRKKNASVRNGVFENFSFSVNNEKCEVQSFGCPEKKSSDFFSWALCCETWANCKLKLREKMFGSWVTPLVGRHVVNEP